MRAVFQRVLSASVAVDGATIASIGAGALVLLGVGNGDDDSDAGYMARKLAELRVFADTEGRFNLSLLDTGGEALVVSQFTLFGDTRKGRRPGFTGAAQPEVAAPLVERVVVLLNAQGVRTRTGHFGAHMQVSLVNDGPVTLWLDSRGT